jgi:hypothetical protein
MEKFNFKTNKIKLLFIIAIMFCICVLVFITFGSSWLQEGRKFDTGFFAVLVIPFAVWYLILFLSVMKEEYSEVEFDGVNNTISVFRKNGAKTVIPFENVKLVKFETGSCVRYVFNTKISIYTNNNQCYKLTIPNEIRAKDSVITKLSGQINICHRLTFLLMP